MTTVSKFNNFSPVRAKKIQGQKLLNYIPNKDLKNFAHYLTIEIKRSFIYLYSIIYCIESQSIK